KSYKSTLHKSSSFQNKIAADYLETFQIWGGVIHICKKKEQDDEHTSTIYYNRDNIRINNERVTILPVNKKDGTPVNYIQPPISFPPSPVPSISTPLAPSISAPLAPLISSSSALSALSVPSTSNSSVKSISNPSVTSTSGPSVTSAPNSYPTPLSDTETPKLSNSEDIIPESFNKMIKRNIYEVDAMIKTYEDKILELKKKRKIMLELYY
ncbi:hypothetical protein BJ944DRAFT_235588, partial [Cunninghamella echinulata]